MLRKIYMKEMKDAFRDRRTLLLTVLVPILMMTAMTFFYESMISGDEGETYNLAVASSIGTEEESILSMNENIEIIKSEEPEQAVLEGEAHAALLLEDDFQSEIISGSQVEATIVGDSFSQNSATLMSIVTSHLQLYERNIVAENLQSQGIDPSVVEPINLVEREISAENPNINLLAMLIPLMLALAIGIGAGPAAADLFAGEKERKTMEALLMTPVNRSTMLLAKWLTIVSIGSIIGIVTLLVVALEIQFFTVHLQEAVSDSLEGQTYVIIGGGVVISIVYAMFTASLLMLTSIIGKTVKEAQSYSTPVMMLVIFPIMVITGVGVNELSFIHFAIPFLNLFSLIKELLFGIVNYEHILITVVSNLIVVVVVLIISRILFMKDRWVMD
ncbi:ABC transporter permease [Virgibacillus oceani]